MKLQNGGLRNLKIDSQAGALALEVGDGKFSSPLALNGMVIFGSDDGHLYALK